MVAHLVKPLMNIDITKPQLFYWQMFLFSEQTTFPTPFKVILVTVTTITSFCTRALHPACTLITIRRCSPPK